MPVGVTSSCVCSFIVAFGCQVIPQAFAIPIIYECEMSSCCMCVGDDVWPLAFSGEWNFSVLDATKKTFILLEQ